jgi:hypothetical protein
MVSDEVDIDDVKTAMENVCIDSVAHVMKRLATTYGEYFETEVALNEQFVSIMATITGEIIAGFPLEEQARVAEEAIEQVHYAWDIAVAEIAAEEAQADDDDVKPIESKFNLAKMKPQGNC